MTSLEDKAADDSDDVVLTRDLPGVYRLGELDELYPADAIGSEDFPQYGDFLKAQYETGNMETVYLECPADLAQQLIEAGAEPGHVLAVKGVNKVEGGRWAVDADVQTPDDGQQRSLQSVADGE